MFLLLDFLKLNSQFHMSNQVMSGVAHAAFAVPKARVKTMSYWNILCMLSPQLLTHCQHHRCPCSCQTGPLASNCCRILGLYLLSRQWDVGDMASQSSNSLDKASNAWTLIELEWLSGWPDRWLGFQPGWSTSNKRPMHCCSRSFLCFSSAFSWYNCSAKDTCDWCCVAWRAASRRSISVSRSLICAFFHFWQLCNSSDPSACCLG